jgi:sulfite reductase beta subunit-like hemoprotein
LRAAVRDGQRGFRVVVGGGLGSLPLEARLLDEFLPTAQLLPRVEAIIRVFNQYGNRENRHLARLKFVLRSRGIDWFREHVDREYVLILAEGGIEEPEMVPEGFGGFEPQPQPVRAGALLPIVHPDPATPDLDKPGGADPALFTDWGR